MNNSQINGEYPTDLFWMGFFMNMTKNFYLFFPAIILLFIGIWNMPCLVIGWTLMIVDVVLSYIEQCEIRDGIKNSNNPNFDEWKNAMLSSDWKENVKDLLDSKIENAKKEDSEDSSL